jgi:hypothetical protein
MKAYQGAGKDGSDGSGEVVVDAANQHYVLNCFQKCK